MNATTEPGPVAARITVGVLALVLGAGLMACAPETRVASASSSSPDAAETQSTADRDRAVAFGLLLDMPVSEETRAEAIELADKLRRRYGIDTGYPEEDREHAAARAMEEVIEPLKFSRRELQVMAQSLGYSLEPGECANYCDNVRRLAEAELRKKALRDFADGAPSP